LEGFSLRQLARRLGVFPTALYWHLPGGRNELLGEVAATAFQTVARPFDVDEDWTVWLRDLFRTYRTSLHRHPNIAPLLGAQLVSNSGVNPRLVEDILTVLKRAGFTGQRLVDAYNAVVAAMLGFVTVELAPVPAEDPTNWASRFEDTIRSLDPKQFPNLTDNMDLMANRAFIVRWESGSQNPLNSGFELYLDAVIAGLSALANR
jgi:AcrR family transcriptional regulator